MLKDEATRKPGLRVRRGLGTRDKVEAERLRDQLNVLLSDPRYHAVAAKSHAERSFDALVVEIFYDKIAPIELDFMRLRDQSIPLPDAEVKGYRRVLFLGATGAGKTTLVRQLIGTDSATERFPSTSTAKTTMHDTEIVLAEGPWRGVVTFVSGDETREHLNECISAAALAVSKNADDATVLRRLLNHVSQRFRFNYILGNGPAARGTDFDDDDLTEEQSPIPAGDDGHFDLTETNVVLAEAVGRLRQLADTLSQNLREELNVATDQDDRTLGQLFEEELDQMLRKEDEYHEIADALMDEIEKRFELLPKGEVVRDRQGWPRAWTGEWPKAQRSEFLKAMATFSSNQAQLFGRLLTPLVNGVRASGPFSPLWGEGEAPKLVLLDGEGLGHTPKSSSSVSTAVSRSVELADVVLLVDSATQPMQAAALAALREVIATGNARKLIFAFTHFDEVEGDNLTDASTKAQHVVASGENAGRLLGEELGPAAERALRGRLEKARYFLGDLQEPLSKGSQAGRRTIKQLGKMLAAVDAVIGRPLPAKGRPIYDRIDLALCIKGAAKAFREGWLPRLGLKYNTEIAKEHWTGVRALSRRLSMIWADEYGTLRPVADLRRELVERIYGFIQNPLRWEGPEPTVEEKQLKYDALAGNIGRRLLALASQRVWRERVDQWRLAYDQWGRGSALARSRIIDADIYQSAASVPDVLPSRDRNQFMRVVVNEIKSAAEDEGALVI